MSRETIIRLSGHRGRGLVRQDRHLMVQRVIEGLKGMGYTPDQMLEAASEYWDHAQAALENNPNYTHELHEVYASIANHLFEAVHAKDARSKSRTA